MWVQCCTLIFSNTRISLVARGPEWPLFRLSNSIELRFILSNKYKILKVRKQAPMVLFT